MNNINEIKNKFIEATNNYYNGRATGLTDKEYDDMELQIKSVDSSFNKWDYVKLENEALEEYPHEFSYSQPQFKHMFEEFDELMKAIEEVKKSNPAKKYVLLPKWDGCSITAYYHDGKLSRILTRSNEVTGKCQTDKLKNKVEEFGESTEKSYKKDFEACVSWNDFEYACRGKANGLINSKYLQDEVDKYLYLIPHYSLEDKYIFNLARYDSTNNTYELDGKFYPIDGIILVNINDLNEFYIFKFYYTSYKITKVIDIEWNVSPKKAFIPKIVLDPVVIDGVNVSRVASGSWESMQGIGIGSVVKVVRAGNTIPQITKIISKSDNYGEIKCPYCGSELKYVAGKHYCPNLSTCEVYKIPQEFPWNEVLRDNLIEYLVDWNIIPLTRVNEYQMTELKKYFFEKDIKDWKIEDLDLSYNNLEILNIFWSILIECYLNVIDKTTL